MYDAAYGGSTSKVKRGASVFSHGSGAHCGDDATKHAWFHGGGTACAVAAAHGGCGEGALRDEGLQ